MLTKTQKKKVIDELADKIKRQQCLIFTDAKGIKVNEIQKLRRELKKAEAEYRVAKKTLMSLAIKKEKKDIDISQFEGSLALVFGYKDPISIIKILANFAKTNENLKILGGIVEDKYLTPDEIKELAKIPSREELLAKLVWSIKSPITGLVNILEGNIRNLLGVLNVISNQ
ncbi:MAG: 50S ribosomal protein L10 [Patescibacteria group bacterium]